MSNTELFNSTDEKSVSTSSLQFDPLKYRSEVDMFEITEEQKQELLSTLWSIMRSFVELGFTVDVCGALLSDLTPIPADDKLS